MAICLKLILFKGVNLTLTSICLLHSWREWDKSLDGDRRWSPPLTPKIRSNWIGKSNMNDLASEYQQYQGTTANDREEAFEDEDEEEMGGGRLKMLQCTLAPFLALMVWAWCPGLHLSQAPLKPNITLFSRLSE